MIYITKRKRTKKIHTLGWVKRVTNTEHVRHNEGKKVDVSGARGIGITGAIK
jgi:hypothetical protein